MHVCVYTCVCRYTEVLGMDVCACTCEHVHVVYACVYVCMFACAGTDIRGNA